MEGPKEADLHKLIVCFGVKCPSCLLEVITTTGWHAGVLTGACPSQVRMQLVYIISTSAYLQLTAQQLHGLLGDAARLHDGTSSLLQNTKAQADSLDCNRPVCIPDDWKLDFDLQCAVYTIMIHA